MFKVGDLVKIKKEYFEKYDLDSHVYTIDKVDFGKDKEILITRTCKNNLPFIYIVNEKMIYKI